MATLTQLRQEFIEDNKVVFMPDEDIWTLLNICEKMEQAQQEFCKVAKGMKIIKNGERK